MQTATMVNQFQGRFTMKKTVLFLMAVLMMSVSVPAFAAQKDECELASIDCRNEVDSIQQKIVRLNTEIKKGHRVYTTAELSLIHI